jgi:serine/threonine-protein kinase
MTSEAPSIPGYPLTERLGEGGMGVVYKAKQIAMDRWVAIKILRDELAQEPEYIRRFLKEARLAGRLRHANIVSALDCGETSGRYYMVMEFVEGKPLDQYLKSRGPLPEAEALEIAGGVAEALQYAWAHSVIHRDLKPQNVLLTSDGRAKVCDFGLCRDVRDLPHLTSLGLIHCTPEYASPEQARGEKDIDVRSDLYSLGATLYEMLTGSIPFEAADAATMIVRHAMDRPRPPSERNRAVSPGANQLVLDLLEKAREERPASPAVVLDRIQGMLHPKAGASTTSRTKVTRSWRTQRRARPVASAPPLVAIGVAAGAVILITALALAGRPEGRHGDAPRPRPPVEPPAEIVPEELRRNNLARVLQSYEAGADGSVKHWLLLGPLLSADERGFDSPVARRAEGVDPIPGLEFARADGSMVRWMRHETATGLVDFGDILGWSKDASSVFALAATWIECKEDVSVEFRLETSGGYELQLDGRMLAAAPGRSKGLLRQRIVLGKGWHSILIKVDRLDGRLTLQLHVVTPEGARLPGIRIWH